MNGRAAGAAAVLALLAVGCDRQGPWGGAESESRAGSTTAAASANEKPPARKATTAKKTTTGEPTGTSTKPSGALPTPAVKVDTKVAEAKEHAADTRTTCAAELEGLAACMGDYAVFCGGSKVYALDCSLFVDTSDGESATCGEIEGEIDCGWED